MLWPFFHTSRNSRQGLLSQSEPVRVCCPRRCSGLGRCLRPVPKFSSWSRGYVSRLLASLFHATASLDPSPKSFFLPRILRENSNMVD